VSRKERRFPSRRGNQLPKPPLLEFFALRYEKIKQPPRESARRLNCIQEALTSLTALLNNSLLIVHDSWRRPDYLKLGAHFLNLCGLLSELGCESLYLCLLLRDRCLQLLNFVVQHGLVLGTRARARL
jgi:hypothetical protein